MHRAAPLTSLDRTKGFLRHQSIMMNRMPTWNKNAEMYQLDFHGRATVASCKNIQLADQGGTHADAHLLVGKVGRDRFNVDFSTPFSPLQAFAFSLVVMDNAKMTSRGYPLQTFYGGVARRVRQRWRSQQNRRAVDESSTTQAV